MDTCWYFWKWFRIDCMYAAETRMNVQLIILVFGKRNQFWSQKCPHKFLFAFQINLSRLETNMSNINYKYAQIILNENVLRKQCGVDWMSTSYELPPPSHRIIYSDDNTIITKSISDTKELSLTMLLCDIMFHGKDFLAKWDLYLYYFILLSIYLNLWQVKWWDIQHSNISHTGPFTRTN